ncbi:asparaginyl-tRNA synthetase Slm5, putative [Talaromyces stipitatus ATCC 10500]|uniref:asparagine--tRNA ligase n=1 Tax=Talaromyces stipitatus (strain ATCC 10500 / CBS 375.48 / QM 6759 / NRRL 1006) TaxID=441959 RepID=B8M774_TALSN|nr:asparaginyl-tRNA synthetase Slm5, putative [Talaromyces stipitatus ATCC 10500]EED20294.1 asparaginyl-tRNA synthetase Slm5, putative [Talaromyces stipitatus ATCC 10500]
MRAWRRSFSTSVVKRYSPSSSLAASRLRCAELLNATTATTVTGTIAGDTKTHKYENEEVTLKGFVRSVRKQKRFAFAEISDGSTVKSLQAILTPEQAADLSTGTAIEISGRWKACPAGKEQTHELQTSKVKIVGYADPETYLIQKKYHSPDFLRQIPHLRLRTPFNSLLSRFRSETIYQLGQVFRSVPQGGFVQVQPPLITSSDCEGAGETFTLSPQSSAPPPSGSKGSEDEEHLHFFRSPKYLTVSSQLHLEAYAAELGNVWALSPTFRAEKSKTPRHLSEFYMLEAEVNFTDDLPALLDLVEYLIRDLARRLYDTPVAQEVLSAKRTGESGLDSSDDIHAVLRRRWEVLLSETINWPRITYTRAIELLQDAQTNHGVSFVYPPSWSEGLQLEHEKYIVDTIFQGVPVFVTDYPQKVKPFYMAPSEGADAAHPDQATVACFDLLFPEICEVVGGSLREHRLPQLIIKMREYGLIKHGSTKPSSSSQPNDDKDDEHVLDLSKNYPYLQPSETLGHLQWYADLRRWGTAPHGGFGLGFDRLMGYLAGVSSLRDVVPFPRYFGRADC